MTAGVARGGKASYLRHMAEDAQDQDEIDEEQEEDGPPLAEIEVEVQAVIEEMEANLARAESHATLPRGLRVVSAALAKVAAKLALEVAYKANLDDIPEPDQPAAQPVVAVGLTPEQQASIGVLVETWQLWLPQIVATGDAALFAFAASLGGVIEAHVRAMLPALGFTAEQVEGAMRAAGAFVPASPAPPNGAGQPEAGA